MTDKSETFDYLNNKTVLVTGGGGSIGGELVKQLAALAVKRLIIFDIYENNAYFIAEEVGRAFPALKLHVLIGSVRDRARVFEIFERYRPDVVFHAAAHKHVPLMEASPAEAVKNNVFGTLNVAEAADMTGCERFVLISTDKAVAPTSVMGATKRLCEKVIFGINTKSSTAFACVRFGNVAASAGSVIPLFKRQISAGGPVTVTHPEVNRFFMSVSEAVSLVLTAGETASGGEIFVLDMGECVNIDSLARRMIEDAGLIPDVDIKIVYTGLRDGEKLNETDMLDDPELTPTQYSRIYVKVSSDGDFYPVEKLAHLRKIINTGECDVRGALRELVCDYEY
ncbi:MAG: polysaccharide biosynthesis protein [Clostridia bacterium]|nr:polysaccharide biosynthesis protein [Clostridia bacterium]